MGYCTQADVELRSPPEQLRRPARIVSSVSATTDTLTLDGHGLQTGAPVTVRADAGGSLPSPLVAGTTYYAIRVTDSTFQLAASEGGAAINLTTTGSNVLLVKQIPWDQAIAWATALVGDSVGSAAIVEMEAPYPQIVVEVTCELAASWLRTWAGVESAQLTERIAWAQKTLDRWAVGRPIRGTNAPTGANGAVRASVTSVWVRKSGRIP